MNADVRKKLDLFFGKSNEQIYKAGEILIRADEEPSGVFYLKDGIVRMYAVSAAGEEVVINTFRPVSFFPMSWVLNGIVGHYYFEALTEVKVLKASKEEFLRFLKSEPEVVFDLLSRIYKGLEGYFSRMEYLMSGSAQSRLITEILILAKRFGIFQEGKAVVSLRITEKDLAAQTGIARETVSREIRKLKEKGLIDFKKNELVVNDLANLESELGPV